MSDGASNDDDIKASIRERWAALPPDPPRPAHTAAPRSAGPDAPRSAPARSSAPPPSSRRGAGASSSASLPLIPVAVASVAALLVGFVLPVLYGAGWLRYLSWVGAGVVLALALTPLRRWEPCTASTLMVGSVGIVLAASAFSMLAGALYGLGIPGAFWLGIKAAVMFGAVRATLRQTHDDTLDAA